MLLLYYYKYAKRVNIAFVIINISQENLDTDIFKGRELVAVDQHVNL